MYSFIYQPRLFAMFTNVKKICNTVINFKDQIYVSARQKVPFAIALEKKL